MPATLYNVNKEVFTKEQFRMIMLSLPEYVEESEIDSMFRAADKDSNGYISYREFKRMCVVPKPEPIPEKPLETAATAKIDEDKRREAEKKNKKKSKKAATSKEGTPVEKVDTVVRAK